MVFEKIMQPLFFGRGSDEEVELQLFFKHHKSLLRGAFSLFLGVIVMT
jgi:hypothetical protein